MILELNIGYPEKPLLLDFLRSSITLLWFLTFKKFSLNRFKPCGISITAQEFAVAFHWSWPQTLEYVLIYLGREYRNLHADWSELYAEAEYWSWEWLILKKSPSALTTLAPKRHFTVCFPMHWNDLTGFLFKSDGCFFFSPWTIFA
jgi:hypothetical protein